MEDFSKLNSELIIVRKDDNKELTNLIDSIKLEITNLENDKREE